MSDRTHISAKLISTAREDQRAALERAKELARELDEVQRQADVLGQVLAILNGRNGRAQPKLRKRSGRQMAGKRNVELVRGYMQEKGVAFQSEAARDLKLNPGTVSWSMKELGAQIQATGVTKRGSPQYRWAEADLIKPGGGK